MIIFIILMFIIYKIAINMYYIVNDYTCKARADKYLNSIKSKQDLLFMHFKDLEHLVAEIFRRKGHCVKMTDKFGEGDNGLILDDMCYVMIKKHSLNKLVNVELARKLADHMYKDSIYKGMFISLGDFNNNTRNFCYKNVITCINGSQLLDMCLKFQSDNMLKEGYANLRK